MASSKRLPPLTRAEAEIMQVLWQRNEATVHELVDAMPRSVAYTTMLTLVRILEKKGYVRHELRSGQRAYVYSPAVPQGSARRNHVRDFIARFFGGRTEELLVGLIEDEGLTPETLAELRRRIDARLNGERKKRGKA